MACNCDEEYMLTFPCLQHHSACARASKGPKKGKEKCRREDDIPPELTPDMLECLWDLKEHLLCDEHSKPGKKTFCVVNKSEGNAKGGHEELTYKEMSPWGKHMVSNARLSERDVKLTCFPVAREGNETYSTKCQEV